MQRKKRFEVNMEIARLMAERGTCTRAKVGCVITVENRIVATGYNGAPSGMAHCIDNPEGCVTDETGSCITTVHAEAATIAFCAKKGIATNGGYMYVTLSPCVACAKLIINAGIKFVVFDQLYHNQEGLFLLIRAGIEVYRFEDKNKKEGPKLCPLTRNLPRV